MTKDPEQIILSALWSAWKAGKGFDDEEAVMPSLDVARELYRKTCGVDQLIERIKYLEAQHDTLSDLTSETLVWIDNWGARFTEKPNRRWQKHRARIDAALNSTEEATDE